jgi:hypothetical protein
VREGVENHSIDTSVSQQLEGWHRLTLSRGSVEHCDLTHAWNMVRFCYHFVDSQTRYKRIARKICSLASSFELLGRKCTVTTY